MNRIYIERNIKEAGKVFTWLISEKKNYLLTKLDLFFRLFSFKQN